VETDTSETGKHPRSSADTLPDADEIFKEVQLMTNKWDDSTLPLSERTVIKDRLRYLNGRCQWITNEVQRKYVQQPIDNLWEKIIHSA
jgi:MoxR-like ATPase